LILLSNYFLFGKKDEKLFDDIVKTSMKSSLNINKRNNILNRIKLSLRSCRNDKL